MTKMFEHRNTSSGGLAVVKDDMISSHIHYLHSIRYRESTIYARELFLRRFFAFHMGVQLCHITREHCEQFLDRHEISARGRNGEINHLRSFFGWCLAENHIELDPTIRLHRPKVPRSLPRPMSDDDLTTALMLAPKRIRPWIMIGAYSGLRGCEIAQLRGEHCDVKNQTIFVADGKGGGQSSVPMSPLLVPVFEQLPSRGWLFPRWDERGLEIDGHITAHRLQAIANRFLHSIGIESTFHSLRHWYGTNCYRQTRDIRLTQELMRHNSVESTAIYTKVDHDEAAEVVANLPSLCA